MIKSQLAMLNHIDLDFEDFYVITLWNTRLELQGNLTHKTLKTAKDLDVALNWNHNTNALEGVNGDIRMCLTAKLES